MERRAGILGQRGPVAVVADEEGDASPTPSSPLLVPGGLTLSDSEKAEALADSLEAVSAGELPVVTGSY
jgi:hypothetical protein